MEFPQPTERRLVIRALEHWNRWRGDNPFPAPSQVVPAELGADWDDSVLMELSIDGGNWVFRHVGANLKTPDMGDGVGWPVEECSESMLVRHATAYFPKVLQKHIPVSMSGEFKHGIATILYRSIVLPLSSDGTTIDGLLGAANSRTVTSQDDLVWMEFE